MSAEGLRPLEDLRERLIRDRTLFFAAQETQVHIAERVWGRGELTDGSNLQYKEDYEVYAYRPPSPRAVSRKGKPYRQWKRPPANPKGDAREIKGGYYDTYLKYKQAMGRYEFELTGRLRKEVLSAASLVEVSPFEVQVVLRGENAAKYAGLTASKGAFLSPNDAEVKYFAERLTAPEV